MLVVTVMLGVASEGSKKEPREWGDRQIRGGGGRRREIAKGGDINPFAATQRGILEFLGGEILEELILVFQRRATLLREQRQEFQLFSERKKKRL